MAAETLHSLTNALETAVSPECKLSVTVRELEVADIRKLQPILEAWVKDEGHVQQDEVERILLNMVSSKVGHNKRKYLVAESSKGEVIGTVGYKDPDEIMQNVASTPKPLEIINAFVHPEFLGKGAGSALFDKVEKIAQKKRYTEVFLNSGSRYEDSAWPFYVSRYGEPSAYIPDMYGPGEGAPVWSRTIDLPKEKSLF
jgi:N-acetylglutamate synthase-like GNAT family acetyltransferase